MLATTAVIGFAAATLLCGDAGGQGVRPDIVLNKEIHKNPRLGDHIRMTHTVARGDTLWRALTKTYGWEREQIPEALRQVMALNPSVKNPNLIYPNQKLVVPVPVPSVEPPPPLPAKTAVPAKPTATPAQKLEIRIGLPSQDALLPAGFTGVSEGIAALFAALGQKVQTSGELTVPIASGGSITIDARHYPVITLPEGRKLLVDLLGGIGERDRKLIETHWQGGQVLSFSPEIPPRMVIDKLLEASAFARFRRKEEITCGRKATLTMVPDWQVVATGEELLSGERITLVSWIDTGAAPLPQEWSAFLSTFGFSLIEIGPGAVPVAKEAATAPPPAFDLTGMEVIDAVESLVRGLGLSTRRGLSIQVSDETGLPTPAVTIDLTVTAGPNLYLIDFGHLRPEEMGLLSSYRNRLVVLSPSELPTYWIPRLLTTLGFKSRKVNSYFTEGGNGRAVLKLSTVQVSDDKGTVVFADGELQDDLLYYLRRQGSRIGIY
jgi:hypothetical protein